jgi:hypothetical protein
MVAVKWELPMTWREYIEGLLVAVGGCRFKTNRDGLFRQSHMGRSGLKQEFKKSAFLKGELQHS